MNSISTAQISDGSTSSTTTLTETGAIGDSGSVTVTPTNGSVFVGWSLTMNQSDIFSTDLTLSFVFDTAITYYAIVLKNDVIMQEFCFYDKTSTTTTQICESQLSSFGLGCINVVKVYFRLTDYDSGDLTSITWYDDETLTNMIYDGYFTAITDIYGNTINSNQPIYNVTSGNAIYVGICGGDTPIIECIP